MKYFRTGLSGGIPECDVILEELNASITMLEARNTILETEINSQSQKATGIPGEIDALEVQLAELDAEILTMPDGKNRNDKVLERNRLDSERVRLNNRQLSLMGIKITDKQYSVNLNDFKIQAATDYKTAVETRKTEIQNSANAA